MTAILLPAPIAGFTDHAFRRVLARCGASITYTEMISATALSYGSERTEKMLGHDDNTAVQLFGKTPEHFERAIRSGLLDGFVEININMGCPARKISGNCEGVALMKKPDLARQIIESCVRASRVPISVKFRLGFDSFTAIEFAKMCERAGAAKIIVHGRTGAQGYSGTADWNAIAEVVRAVKIPVIANGDVTSYETLKKCLDITGAAGVMIGRGMLGAPWLFAELQRENGLPKTTTTEMKDAVKYHIDQVRQLKGDDSILEMRKHLLCYASHLDITKEEKKRLAVVKTFDEASEILGLINSSGVF
jgi:tRNA-dihydrouridine synthase B